MKAAETKLMEALGWEGVGLIASVSAGTFNGEDA
jgi:hypothetical protein